MWNTKVREAKSVSVAEHLSEGCSQESTARLVNVDISVVQRLNDLIGKHGRLFHEERVKDVAYRPSRHGAAGRRPNIRYRIPRTLAHVQIIKRREGARVVEVAVRYTHGSRKRATQALDVLGYTQPKTSAIERRNGTARRMSVYQIRKSIAFSRRSDAKDALGWWGVTVYNWCRKHRSLRMPLAQPVGKRSTNRLHQPWRPVSPITFSQSGNSCSHLSFQRSPGDNLT